VALHDHVDLAGLTAPVAGQDPVAVTDASACGHPLSPAAQGDVPGRREPTVGRGRVYGTTRHAGDAALGL
jgi:hypothetical protein